MKALALSALSLLCYFGGLGALVYGCWLVYRPAGWIVAGLLIFGLSLLMDRAKGKQQQQDDESR